MNRRVVALLSVTVAAPAFAGVLGPMAYDSPASSPLAFLGDNMRLEDFEDGLINTPGVQVTGGVVLSGNQYVDSVDSDDGVIDGVCANGHSLFQQASATGITFSFSNSFDGNLPNWVGIVWTDGHNDINFEAFDAQGNSLGVLTGSHADAVWNGSVEEDRFYGAYNASGIASFHIWNGNGGIEVDHLQFGYETVPTPGALALSVVGLGLLRGRRRS